MNPSRPTRRRFLTLVAALPASAGLPLLAEPPRLVRGQAMGAQVSLRLHHPEADRLGQLALAEISRLEGMFSLYRADSALMRLNRTGVLDAPPPELLACLSLCDAVHRASGGRFDPTVQPLWACLAEAHARNLDPDPAQVRAARRLIGWERVAFGPDRITLGAGMALTLNGVAQGIVADRLASLLRSEGLELGLIDAGEITAIGADWPVRILDGPRLRLSDRALATSGPFGTVMDRDGRQGHILSPDADAAPPVWRSVSISAPQAAVADALSTAACVLDDMTSLRVMVAAFEGARVEALTAMA